MLDPFCGCGTTVAAAQEMNRQWIGIDVTHLAILLIKRRLEDQTNGAAAYQVIGEPKDLAGAAELARTDKYQFQWWALDLVGGRPAEQKKGADRGIDGCIYFQDGLVGEPAKQIVISVKAGGATVSHLRDLRGVVEREGAALGVLITMQEPTKPMLNEAAEGGYYSPPRSERKYPKLQILTIADILAGRGIDCPPLEHGNVTFKKAPRAKTPQAKTVPMELE